MCCVCMVMTPVFGEFGMPGTFYTHTLAHALDEMQSADAERNPTGS